MEDYRYGCNVYSLPDMKSVLFHPDIGTANLHLCGIGNLRFPVRHGMDAGTHQGTDLQQIIESLQEYTSLREHFSRVCSAGKSLKSSCDAQYV